MKAETHSLVATIVLTIAVLLGCWTTYQNQMLINNRQDAVNRIEGMVKDIHTKTGAGKTDLGPVP